MMISQSTRSEGAVLLYTRFEKIIRRRNGPPHDELQIEPSDCGKRRYGRKENKSVSETLSAARDDRPKPLLFILMMKRKKRL
ncbi:hypothetical protein PO124_28520 [Bacillus licheniformis]|nr:hypothetical protein [Bacillus licheniformis]